ncbi:hypothetical protein [uncultured Vibrio sp.]|uniref:hypothetical protein n=1 Tax=uncultured Vibrio sp. TaxID=114054 RepID=UPI0026172E3D|nr:hypothetical protein [uncultured Vibrio sp.]
MRNILILSGLLSLTGTAIADARVEAEWMKESYPADVTLVEGVDMVIKDGVTLCLTSTSNNEAFSEIIIDCNGERTRRVLTSSVDAEVQEEGAEIVDSRVFDISLISPKGVKVSNETKLELLNELLTFNLDENTRNFVERMIERFKNESKFSSTVLKRDIEGNNNYRLDVQAPYGRYAWGGSIRTFSYHSIDVSINIGAAYTYEYQQKVFGSTTTHRNSLQIGAGNEWQQFGDTMLTVLIPKPGIYQTSAYTEIWGGGLDGVVLGKGEINAT